MAGPFKRKCPILDVGCGMGSVGEYLKQDGFLNISGIDCSKNLIKIAEEKKIYQKLDKIVMGESDVVPQEEGKYDFVISASMINNEGWDEKIFLQLLHYVKMGGFIIFSTKLNLNKDNLYGP